MCIKCERSFIVILVVFSSIASVGSYSAAAQTHEAELDRTKLPIQAPRHEPITELDARDAEPPPRFEVKAPKVAPNIVIVLIDDIGFGTSGAFGGPLTTRTFDRLAEGGLRYNQFHTTAL